MPRSALFVERAIHSGAAASVEFEPVKEVETRLEGTVVKLFVFAVVTQFV
jgi:hypothetical protein